MRATSSQGVPAPAMLLNDTDINAIRQLVSDELGMLIVSVVTTRS